MANMPYRVDPAIKLLDVNIDFSGGMNSVDADSTMSNSQMRKIENFELTTKGSLVKREGFSRYADLSAVTKATTITGIQCYMRYYDKDFNLKEFYMIDGAIYDDKGTLQKYKNLDETPVFVNADGFQKERLTSYVVYNDIMLIATGNFLLEYGLFPDKDPADVPEGETATESYYFRQLNPYKPKALEFSKIGANLLSDDPWNFIEDGVASVLVNEGVVSTNRTATANIAEELTTYLSRPSSSDVYIKWEVRESGEPDWKEINGTGFKKIDFTTKENKRIKHTFEKSGLYDIKSSITATATQTDPTKIYSYVISDFKVTDTEDIEEKEDYKPQTCTNLYIYYDQILMWGDLNVSNAIYVSDIFKPSYVPSDNVIAIPTTQEDFITGVVYFYQVLVIATNNTLHYLVGINPMDFQLRPISATIGCIAPSSLVGVENDIIFLSREGLYKLKTLSVVTSDRYGVERIDMDVWKSIPKPFDTTACAVQNGLAYVITFPKYKIRMKWYYKQKVWAMDSGDIFDFNFIRIIDGEYYGFKPNGTVVKQDGAVYNDDGKPIKCVLETKNYDLGYPVHLKKLKAVKISFMNDEEKPTSLFMTVNVDNKPVINPEQYLIYEKDDQILFSLEKSTNVELFSGTKFGSWVLGKSKVGIVPTTINKYRLTGKGYTVTLKIEHEDDTDFGLLGYAYIYKVKKP